MAARNILLHLIAGLSVNKAEGLLVRFLPCLPVDLALTVETILIKAVESDYLYANAGAMCTRL